MTNFLLEGKEMLCSGLSNFNKVASEKFEELDDDEKSRLAEIAENDTDTVLTDQQTDNIVATPLLLDLEKIESS